MDSRENHIDSTSVLRVADAGYLQAVITTQSILDANYETRPGKPTISIV